MRRRYLILSLVSVLSLGIFLGQGEEVFAAGLSRVDLSRQEAIRELECELFEQRIKNTRDSILFDLKSGRITEAMAREELAQIDYLELNFKNGILPRETKLEEGRYQAGTSNYRWNENYGNYLGHHPDRNHQNYNGRILNGRTDYNTNRHYNGQPGRSHHNGGCRRY